MAISALSAIGGSFFPGYRVGAITGSGPLGRLGRIEAIPALGDRALLSERQTEPQSASAAEKDRIARLGALDPRSPESIIVQRRDTEKVPDKQASAKEASAKEAVDEASKREVEERLGELLGERSSLELKQAEEKGARTSAVISELAQLKTRDSEVRAHESAHMAAGGRYITGGASYTYQKGPDGGQYAVGGEVGIDSSPVPGKPEETAEKMRIVRAAALAPSDPSAADLSVAASAAQVEAEALSEIAQARSDEASRVPGAASWYAEEGTAGGSRGRSGISESALDMVA